MLYSTELSLLHKLKLTTCVTDISQAAVYSITATAIVIVLYSVVPVSTV
jgi:hypothetical protein